MLKKEKYSEISLEFIKHYLRVDFDDDDIELQTYLDIAKNYVEKQSNRTVEELDTMSMANGIVFKLIHDFYEQKGAVLNGANLKLDPIYEMMINTLRKY